MVFSTHTISRGRAAKKKGKKWKNSMTSNTEPQLGFSPALINKGKKKSSPWECPAFHFILCSPGSVSWTLIESHNCFLTGAVKWHWRLDCLTHTLTHTRLIVTKHRACCRSRTRAGQGRASSRQSSAGPKHSQLHVSGEANARLCNTAGGGESDKAATQLSKKKLRWN